VDNKKKNSNKFGYTQHKHSYIYGLHVCWALTSGNVKTEFVVQESSLSVPSHQSLEVWIKMYMYLNQPVEVNLLQIKILNCI